MRGLACAALIAACGGPSAPDAVPTTSASGRPRLVVLLVIDQWPEWSLEWKRPELHGGGIDRLLSEGAWHVGRHPSAVTLTAPGHSLLGTGAPTATTGILANEWWHRDSGKVLMSVEAEDGSVSPKWLRVAALGDAVAAAGTGAKAVSVSLKDRAAVLPLGHHGTAIWYHAKTVDWMSNQRLEWLDAWNRSQPIAFHLHDVWEASDPERLHRVSGRRDYNSAEAGAKGLGTTFPHAIDMTKNPAEAIFATPLGNELVLDTALAAIDGEHLGADDAPDLLVVSLSAHDYIAHGWGHESWETWDGEIRLDHDLARFMAGLDHKVGSWAMVVTSDHGGSHLPELVNGGRLRYSQVEERANAAAESVLGKGTWVAFAEQPTVFLSEAARDLPASQQDKALNAIIDGLRDMPGIERAERSADLMGNCADRPPADRPLCYALDHERSGEIIYTEKAGWVLEDDGDAICTSHGTSHDYDQLVPLIELAPDRKVHAPQTEPDREVPETDVAGIIAKWLGVKPPRELPPPPPETGWLP
jgi:hypothetical protein